jgi:hypothetical protein
MTTPVFEPRPLPTPVANTLRERLLRAHRAEPFSTIEPRRTVQRVAALLTDLGLESVVFRGGVDLRSSEADHVWLAVTRVDAGDGPYVVDAAFPLFAEAFVATLRSYVAGDAGPDDLAAAAARAGVDERVMGEFPRPLRYLGRPVWSRPSSR